MEISEWKKVFSGAPTDFTPSGWVGEPDKGRIRLRALTVLIMMWVRCAPIWCFRDFPKIYPNLVLEASPNWNLKRHIYQLPHFDITSAMCVAPGTSALLGFAQHKVSSYLQIYHIFFIVFTHSCLFLCFGNN